MANVTYKGTSSRKSAVTVVYVDGKRFDEDQPVKVEDEALLKELREGSDRLAGHKFEVEGDSTSKPAAPAQKPEFKG